ncbi:MAG TPA: hypothetical protein VFX16_23970 [Pseudonocardiaceae bacterium]|nr:hypothetical protein [Pseudonocardiaceae bacterium]
MPDVDSQILALVEIVGTVAATVSGLSRRVDALAGEVGDAGTDPAPWVWSSPPSSPGDESATVVDNFVAFYNATFAGVVGGRARPIPPCWREHLGLTAEVATVAYAWRAANLGATANVRDAQYWLQQWRPGFADRMVRDWVHIDCFDGAHREVVG